MGKTQLTTTACREMLLLYCQNWRAPCHTAMSGMMLRRENVEHPELRLYLQPASFSGVVTTHICSSVHGDKWLGGEILSWSTVDISLRLWKRGKMTNQTHSVSLRCDVTCSSQRAHPILTTGFFSISITESAPSTGTKWFCWFYSPLEKKKACFCCIGYHKYLQNIIWKSM